jgi:hypothetical protein
VQGPGFDPWPWGKTKDQKQSFLHFGVSVHGLFIDFSGPTLFKQK